MMLPVALMAVAMLISYQRAKAESLGYDAKGGLMERAERFIVLGFGLLFSELLVGVLWVMLVLSALTAGQRFVKVWRQASAERVVPVTARQMQRQLQRNRRREQRAAHRRRPTRLRPTLRERAAAIQRERPSPTIDRERPPRKR
jgi:CDP-diacylglycerol--glycerol-3-phosphate 3-phosphatidyltransferase